MFHNFGIDHVLPETPLRPGIYLMHQIWCFYNRILLILTTVPEKQQMLDYFYLKQTFYMPCFENAEKNKKREREKRIRTGHGIRHDRQATADSQQSSR